MGYSPWGRKESRTTERGRHAHTHATHTHTHFLARFHDGLSQDIGYGSVCSIVGPWCVSTLYVIVFVR